MVLKIYTKTFGCLINEYDTYRIIELLKRVFYIEITNDSKSADVFLLNSCAVRRKVEKKVLSELLSWFLIKKNKNVVVILVGCFTFLETKVKKYVDLIVRNNEIDKIPEYLLKKTIHYTEFFKAHKKCGYNKEMFTKFYPKVKTTGPSVCVPISDGCNNSCTYCAVPIIRGMEVNRSLQSIVNDVTYYTKQGIKEIVLLGQNVNAYKYNTITFVNLLDIISDIHGVERIKFLTAHPNYITDDLIKCYEKNEKLVNHIHLPLQSGSTIILDKMKRGYSYDTYKEKITKLKQVRPNITITTDIIVGFPGETSLDFKETLRSIKEIGFDFSYCFIYSKRPKTAACHYKDNVELRIKKERLQYVQRVFLENGTSITSKYLHTVQKVLFFGFLDINLYWGKTDYNRTVLLTSYENVVGLLLNIKLVRVVNNTYIGVRV